MRHNYQNDAPHYGDYESLPPIDDAPPIGQIVTGGTKFILAHYRDILVQEGESWLLDRIFPSVGVGVLFGASGSFKSFIALDWALAIATGRTWGGRETVQGNVVYIASEGAYGLRKRKVGWSINNDAPPDDIGFWMIDTAPNLGGGGNDLGALTEAITGARVCPSMIVIDTLSASLGAGDENGSGMQMFVQNAQALAMQFKCFVLVVHHVGHSAEGRMRGHSSLRGGVDAALLCERQEGMAARVSLAKVKDESDDLAFTINLLRTVVATDARGRDVATLVVSDVVETDAKPKAKPKTVTPKQRLLIDCINDRLDLVGETIQPFADGPQVRAVCDSKVRSEYYRRIAEQAGEGENPRTLAERQRKEFGRSVKALLDNKTIAAANLQGRRLLWPI